MSFFSALGWVRKKYELYKSGKFQIEKFADPLNKRGYTLAELKALDKKTFELLGI